MHYFNSVMLKSLHTNFSSISHQIFLTTVGGVASNHMTLQKKNNNCICSRTEYSKCVEGTRQILNSVLKVKKSRYVVLSLAISMKVHS